MDALSRYTSDLAAVQEIVDNDAPSYFVRCRGLEYAIYSAALSHDACSGSAAYAFFKIVNDQLAKSSYRLYAINGGNDLGGMFLTPSECVGARRSLPRREDWPYLTTLEHPWYGQYH